MANHLFDALAKAALQRADEAAIRVPGGRTWSYSDLLEATARLAGRLSRLGVEPNDRVAVQVDKSAEALLLYLACVRAGAVYLPLNSAYTLAELDYFIGDATPSLVVASPGAAAGVGALAVKHGARLETLDAQGGGSLLDGFEKQANLDPVDRSPADLAAILYTSGTTGRSKGAMLTHGNLLSNAETLVEFWRFTADDRLIHALPIFHTHGLFVASNTVLLAGASMDLLPRFDAGQVLDLMDEATCLMGVPTFYVRLLQEQRLTRQTVRNMRLFVSGSAPLLAETHRQFSDRTGHAILERYGMTETNMNTSNPYDGERRPGTVGFPLPGVKLRVVDPESGGAVTAGAIGMIEVQGPNVFKGYWNMPEKTEAEFRDGYFITGDLGRIDEDGYVHIVGRGKDLVISGGYNVYPKEVEAEIDAVPGVVESAVIGVPHPELGEGVTAIVVRKPDGNLAEDDVIAALRDKLARFKQPKRVIFLDELPRNTMGKVQKNVLRQTYQELYRTA